MRIFAPRKALRLLPKRFASFWKEPCYFSGKVVALFPAWQGVRGKKRPTAESERNRIL